ncbi:MAG: dockerin type I repeat-containing protein [Oscillospiraceae bacterium]
MKKICAFLTALIVCSSSLYYFNRNYINAVSNEKYDAEKINALLDNADNLAEFSLENKTISLAEAEKPVTLEFKLDNDTYINNAVFNFVYNANEIMLTDVSYGSGIHADDFGGHNVTSTIPLNVDYTSEYKGAEGQLLILTFKIRNPEAGKKYIISVNDDGTVSRTEADGSETEMISAYNYGCIEVENDNENVTTTAETTVTSETTTETTAESEPYVPDKKEFTWNEDNWNFTNSHKYFGYDDYYVSDDYLDILLNQSTNIEKEYIIELRYSDWGGSCYGMAVTSILSKNSVFNVPQWYSGAEYIHGLPSPDKNDDVKSLINYYFLTQVTDEIQQARNITDFECEQVKINSVKEYFANPENASNPLLFCFVQPWWGGHAVVAYDDCEESGNIEGFKYTGYFKIYDNNSENYDTRFNLYYNTDSWQWYIPVYDIGSLYGGYISLVTSDLKLINTHGYFPLNENFSTINSDLYDSFIASMSSVVSDNNFKVTKIKDTDDFGAAGDNIDDDEIKFSHSMLESNDASSVNILLKDYSSGYRYEVNDENPAKIDVSMRYENSAFKIKSDLGNAVEFLPDGVAAVENASGDFEISMTFNENYYDIPWYTLGISGSDSENTVLQQTENGFILSGDNLNNITVNANNDDIKTGIRFSTDFQNVFIYSIDEATIGVKADTDNDGVFEKDIQTTPVETLIAGDIDGDGKLTANDALNILQAVTDVINLNEEQKSLADMDNDGEITSADALIVLQYIVGIR